MAKFFALASLVVGCIAVADLVGHPTGTTDLANAGVTAEKTATNALLGQTTS